MNLARYEQEVVINLNADEDTATLYSANPSWIRKMDKLVQEFPEVFILKRQTEINKTYELPKKLVHIMIHFIMQHPAQSVNFLLILHILGQRSVIYVSFIHGDLK